MKRQIQAALLMIATLAAACGSSPPPAATGPDPVQAGVPQLRRDGRWLVDEKNRIVLVHGVNLVWKTPPYVPPDSAEGFTPADAQWLREHGFNGARVGTLWVGVTPEAPGAVDLDYLAQWDRVVQLLAGARIWTLFDFHQDQMSPEFQGEGVPDWAVEPLKGPANEAPPPMFGFPFNYFTPQVSELFDNLWQERGVVWDGFRDAWIAVAQQWRDQPYSMGYDLLNEPWAGQEWPQCILIFAGGCPAADRDEIQPFMEHALTGIRRVDAHNLVWFEPQLLSGGTATATGLQPVSGESQLGYSFHNYCPYAALLQSLQATAQVPVPFDPSTSCESFVYDVTAEGVTASERMQAVAAMTEFGASDDLTIIRQTAQAADLHFMPWFYWHYKNWSDPTTQSQGSGSQSLFTDDTDFASVKIEKLRLVERTYPQATAGTPLSLIFDPDSGAFEYRYTPRAARGPTEIYVPVALHYPDGYDVSVSGARVTSAADAPLLVLENVAGAAEVMVSVSRRPEASAR